MTTATITILGHLVADPFFLPGSNDKKAFARFRVMVNPFGTKSDNQTPLDPVAFNVVAFDKRADYVNQYLKKGTQVLVIGDITAIAPAMKDGQVVKTKSGDIVIDADINPQKILMTSSKDGSSTSTRQSTEIPELSITVPDPF